MINAGTDHPSRRTARASGLDRRTSQKVRSSWRMIRLLARELSGELYFLCTSSYVQVILVTLKLRHTILDISLASWLWKVPVQSSSILSLSWPSVRCWFIMCLQGLFFSLCKICKCKNRSKWSGSAFLTFSTIRSNLI